MIVSFLLSAKNDVVCTKPTQNKTKFTVLLFTQNWLYCFVRTQNSWLKSIGNSRRDVIDFIDY